MMGALALLASCGRIAYDLVAGDAGADGTVDASDANPAASCVDSRTYPGGGIELADFASATGLVLNGTATVVGDVLRLTDAKNNSVGGAYFGAPVAIEPGTSVFVHFGYRIGQAAPTGWRSRSRTLRMGPWRWA
jgi:hypothetical protein